MADANNAINVIGDLSVFELLKELFANENYAEADILLLSSFRDMQGGWPLVCSAREITVESTAKLIKQHTFLDFVDSKLYAGFVEGVAFSKASSNIAEPCELHYDRVVAYLTWKIISEFKEGSSVKSQDKRDKSVQGFLAVENLLQKSEEMWPRHHYPLTDAWYMSHPVRAHIIHRKIQKNLVSFKLYGNSPYFGRKLWTLYVACFAVKYG